MLNNLVITIHKQNYRHHKNVMQSFITQILYDLYSTRCHKARRCECSSICRFRTSCCWGPFKYPGQHCLVQNSMDIYCATGSNLETLEELLDHLMALPIASYHRTFLGLRWVQFAKQEQQLTEISFGVARVQTSCPA